MSTGIKNGVYATDPEQWDDEKIAEAGLRLRETIRRQRKARGDTETQHEAEAKAKAEKRKKKETKPPENLDIDKPL